MTTPADGLHVILVAEDDPPVREMIDLVLRMRGYHPVVCADGVEALAALDSYERIDAALLDLRMPRLHGVGVIRAIRAHGRWGGLPVIAMSAFSDELQAQEVAEAGADVFLAKPFTVQELSDALAALHTARSAPADG